MMYKNGTVVRGSTSQVDSDRKYPPSAVNKEVHILFWAGRTTHTDTHRHRVCLPHFIPRHDPLSLSLPLSLSSMSVPHHVP